MTKKIISILVSTALCLLTAISGAHAFLQSYMKLTNTFLVGDCEIELINNNAEVLMGPGESAEYSSEIKNTGQVNAYVYMVIGDPLYTTGDTFSSKDLKVTAYAIQENYKSMDNADDIWTAYFNPVSVLGEENTDINKTPVFTLLYGGEEGLNNKSWTLMSTYQTADSYYYLCKYNAGLLEPGESTGTILDQIKVSEKIGDPEGHSIAPYTFFMDYYTVSDNILVNTGSFSSFDVWNFDGDDSYTPAGLTYMGKVDDVLCLVSVDDDGEVTKYPGVSPEYYLFNYLQNGEDEQLADNEVDTSLTLYLAMIDKSGNMVLNDDDTVDEYYYLGVQWEDKIFPEGTVSYNDILNIGAGEYISSDISVSGMTMSSLDEYPELYDLLNDSIADETHILSDKSDIELSKDIIYYEIMT